MDTKDRFLKMEENTKTTVSTLDTNESSTKTIKYEFTEPLERDENITSRCRILLAIKQFVMQRKNRFLELEEKEKLLSCVLPILMNAALKSLNAILQTPCNRTKALPVDAQLHSL